MTLPDSSNSFSAIRIETSPDTAPPDKDAPAFKEYRVLSTNLPAEGFRGQYVRIDLPAGNPPYSRGNANDQAKNYNVLSLAEVQVFQGRENLTSGGSARHSITNIGAEAQRAIDGNTNGVLGQNSTTHTASDKAPWWEVDLHGEKEFDRIVI